ncbi:MAG: AAA family ATPase, partial [bacterium]|nr:AAA family ATPase [bacterium]
MALKNLLIFLNRYHDKRVVVLIDEYDAPIQAGFSHGYYEEAISFLKH